MHFARFEGMDRIELIETHISRVFLLDNDVLKVKKPVSLGFLDFRTLAQREAACKAEVELNARLAPGVYHGVVPIYRDGAIVEWAVHMSRLSDARRADELLRREALQGSDVDAVAERIAQFHESARCDEQTASFGTVDAIAANVKENFAQAGDVAERCIGVEQAREIQRWQERFLADNAHRFEARIRAGHVRDGHGDLRLEHVYLHPLVVIDCIEFNERFRFADTCADIAFLSMDLAFHGRVDLGERLLARYARAANDYDLYAVVDFYQAYRAYVRAKIASIVGREDEARRYFRLALAQEKPWLLQPTVVAVGGVIASGKSTVAGALGAAMSAPVVDADRTRKSMLGVQPTQRLDDAAWHGAYDTHFTDAVYDEVMRRADVVLKSGRPVILDASFRSPRMREIARALAVRHDVPFHFVECRARRESCLARLERRADAASVSDGRSAIFDAFCARWELPDEIPADEHLVVDTDGPIRETMEHVRRDISTWPAQLAG